VVFSSQGSPVFGSNTLFHPYSNVTGDSAASTGVASVRFSKLPLWSGEYYVSVWFSDGLEPLDYIPEAIRFTFLAEGVPPNVPPTHIIGPTRVEGVWEFGEKN
jgi:hypothetical protein